MARRLTPLVLAGTLSLLGSGAAVPADAAPHTTAVSVAVGPTAIATDSSSGKTFVASSYPGMNGVLPSRDGTVAVLGHGGAVGAAIEVGYEPDGVAIDPVTNMVYVTSEGNTREYGEVTVINGATDKVTKTISIQDGLVGIAVDPKTDVIYVGDPEYGTFYVINGKTDKITDTLTVGSSAYSPDGVAVDATTDTIYLVDRSLQFASKLLVINGKTNKVTASVPVGAESDEVAVDPGSNMVYVTNSNTYYANQYKSGTVSL